MQNYYKTVWRGQTIGGRAMGTLSKGQQKLRLVLVFSGSVSLVLAALACHRSPGPVQQSSISGSGGSDAKVAAERTAEAETFYNGREDIQKAREAVASL